MRRKTSAFPLVAAFLLASITACDAVGVATDRIKQHRTKAQTDKAEDINAKSKEFKSVPGVWRSQGYGNILEVSGDTIKYYDICKAGCVSADEKRTEWVVSYAERIMPESKDLFHLYAKGAVTEYHDERIDAVPAPDKIGIRSIRNIVQKSPPGPPRKIWLPFSGRYKENWVICM